MLYIAASNFCMKIQGKLMNQTWENGKKLSFRPYFGPKKVLVDFTWIRC